MQSRVALSRRKLAITRTIKVSRRKKKSISVVSCAVVTGESRMRIATIAIAAGEFVSIRPLRHGDVIDEILSSRITRFVGRDRRFWGHERVDKYITYPCCTRRWPLPKPLKLQNHPRGHTSATSARAECYKIGVILNSIIPLNRRAITELHREMLLFNLFLIVIIHLFSFK